MVEPVCLKANWSFCSWSLVVRLKAWYTLRWIIISIERTGSIEIGLSRTNLLHQLSSAQDGWWRSCIVLVRARLLRFSWWESLWLKRIRWDGQLRYQAGIPSNPSAVWRRWPRMSCLLVDDWSTAAVAFELMLHIFIGGGSIVLVELLGCKACLGVGHLPTSLYLCDPFPEIQQLHFRVNKTEVHFDFPFYRSTYKQGE